MSEEDRKLSKEAQELLKDWQLRGPEPPINCWIIEDQKQNPYFFDETLMTFSTQERAEECIEKCCSEKNLWTPKKIFWAEIISRWSRKYDGAMFDCLPFAGCYPGGGHILFETPHSN